MRTKAKPVSAGMWRNSSWKASRPPAEAPIATTGQGWEFGPRSRAGLDRGSGLVLVLSLQSFRSVIRVLSGLGSSMKPW